MIALLASLAFAADKAPVLLSVDSDDLRFALDSITIAVDARQRGHRP